ncbi:MAG: DUF6062 family protein, partial [Oscillospiraceae bacterium]|nr:DUF6062 family protein [Oscillospiraceae bacterium]
MKEDICSIHVSDFFEAKDGCPICGMNAELEKRAIDYITGPAMMEPDVRQESNRAGFCGKHLEQMLKRQKRLPVALTLESHLLELKKRLGGGVLGSSLKKPANKANSLAKCFVCERVEWGMERQLATVFRLYEK